MKMMPPDVISHENQLQHLSEPSIFMLDVFRTADHAGQIFIPHRRRLNKIRPADGLNSAKDNAVCSDNFQVCLVCNMGPSIYDVHTEGDGVRLRWTHVDGRGGSSPMWTSTQKIKIRVH